MLNLLNATSLLSTINHALRPLLWIGCFVHFFFVRFMFSKNKTTRSLFLSVLCLLCCLVEKIIRFNWKFLRNFNVFFIRLNSNPICFFFIWRRTEWQIATEDVSVIPNLFKQLDNVSIIYTYNHFGQFVLHTFTTKNVKYIGTLDFIFKEKKKCLYII